MSDQIKNQEIKDFRTKVFPAYGAIIIGVLFLLFWAYQTRKEDNNRRTTEVDTPSQIWNIQSWSTNSSWVIVEINTWFINTWVEIPPQDVRSYIDYIVDNWVAWQDYIIVYPPKPPVIRSADKQENNKVIFSYFYRTKVIFTIPNTTKSWYVMFVTNKAVPNTKDFLLSIDWVSKWPIRKNSSMAVSNDNEYLYPMKSITMVWSSGKYNIDLYNSIENNKLWLNAFVWDPWNYVEKIIIFFK